MNLPNQIDVHEIDQVYLVANTPSYLFKHLRACNSVQWMAANLNVEQLEELYRKNRGEEDLTKHSAALAYALIAALSLHEYSAVAETLKRIPVNELSWGRQFIETAISQAIPFTQQTIRLSPRITPNKKNNIPTTSSEFNASQFNHHRTNT